MATLKLKKVKGHEYFYWSRSVWSRKRYGGDGKPRTIDHLIGSHPLGNWLAYRLWSGDVKPEEYAQAVIKWLCPDIWKHIVKVSVDWRRQRVTINSLVPPLIDCRQRRWKREREALQGCLDQIINLSIQIDELIQNAGYLLGEHYRHSQVVEELREKACDARLRPDDFPPDAEEILDECAHAKQRSADQALEYYLKIMGLLEEFAPPKQRSKFKAEAVRKAERLAKDLRWLDEYQAKLVRS